MVQRALAVSPQSAKRGAAAWWSTGLCWRRADGEPWLAGASAAPRFSFPFSAQLSDSSSARNMPNNLLISLLLGYIRES